MVSKIKEKSIANNAITTAKLSTEVSSITGIKVSSIAYLNDDTAANTIGGDIITVNGAGFTPNTTVYVDRTQAGVVTYISNTQITFSSPAKSSGSYILYLYNADGGSAAYIPGINYSGVPSWSTASGSIGTTYEFTSFTGNVTTLSATSDSTVYYLLNSGTLPPGSTLNANTGVISGNTSTVNSQTTYNFVIEAKDQENQGTLRNFSITINPDSVTWASPADGTTVTAYEYGSISQALSSSSAATRPITYTANTLPTGVSISGSTVSGTPTVVGTTNSLITATSNTTNRTATRNLKFQINQDVVTWSSPADGTTINGQVGSPVTQALSASSAAGQSIVYTANTLPSGLSISGSNVTGTPTLAQSITSLITATAATTSRTATRILNWIIAVANDLYFPYVSLLLKTTATNTQTNNTFVDSSSNNYALTRAGTPTQGSFNPYRDVGYWSNYFSGTDNFSFSSNAAFAYGTADFTIECWIYPTTQGATRQIFMSGTSGATQFYLNASNKLEFTISGVAIIATSTATVNINTWTHIAVSRSGTNLRLFINGTLDTTVTNSSNISNNGGNYIASDDVSSNRVTGYISNLRAVKGTAVYTSTFTPSTTPLTAITNTSLLMCQSNYFRDNSTNNLTLTIVGTPRVQEFQPFNLPSSYSIGTYVGSGYFNGTTDYLYNSSVSAVAFGSNNFTVEAWVYPTAAPSGNIYTIASANPGSTNSGWQFYYTNGGLGIRSNFSNFILPLGAATAPPAYTWSHVAWTRNGSTYYIYLNGKQVGSGTTLGTWTDTDITIGTFRSNVAGCAFPGYMSNLRLVNGTAVYSASTNGTQVFTPPTTPLTAITNTCFLANFTNAGIYDAAGQNNGITVGSAQVSTTTSKWNTTSIKFNGTTDYLNILANPALNFGTADNFTIEAWVYVGAFADSFIISGTGGGGFFGFNGTTLIGIGRAGTAWDYTATHGMSTNTWYHVAVTRSSGLVRLYVNGNQVGTTSGSNTNAYNFASPSAYIGSQGTQYYFNGYIQDLRITRLSRSSGTTITLPTAEFFAR